MDEDLTEEVRARKQQMAILLDAMAEAHVRVRRKQPHHKRDLRHVYRQLADNNVCTDKVKKRLNDLGQVPDKHLALYITDDKDGLLFDLKELAVEHQMMERWVKLLSLK